MLTLPGPHKRITRKQRRNKPAWRPSLKISPWLTLKSATDIEMTNGIAASLVNNPRTINILQKNSAKITRDKDMVLPIPRKFIKVLCFSGNWTNLVYPWGIISTPEVTRSINIARLNAQSLHEIDNSFFMCFWILPNVIHSIESERNVNPSTYPHVFGTMFGQSKNI